MPSSERSLTSLAAIAILKTLSSAMKIVALLKTLAQVLRFCKL